MTEAEDLLTRILKVKAGGRKYRQDVKDFFHQAGAGASVEVSSCIGGTQQIANRLTQQAVRESTDLIIFYIEEEDNLELLMDYIADAYRGEKDTPRIPNAPIAIAQLDSQGRASIVVLIAPRKTRASNLVERLFPRVTVTDPFGDWDPEIPDSAELFRLEWSSESINREDIEQFEIPSADPSDKAPKGGDIILFTKSNAADSAVAIGRVARVEDRPPTKTVVLDHATVFNSPIALPEKT